MIGCLILHGYTGSEDELKPLVDFLNEETEWLIVVPILPGHGDKLNLEGKIYEQWLHKAEQSYLDLYEKCHTVYVIGFSMGGLIASFIASRYKVNKLVLLAPATKVLPAKEMIKTLFNIVKDKVNKTLEDNEVYTYISKRITKIPLRAYIEFLKLKIRSKTYFQHIKAPVLIIQGARDDLVPATSVFDLGERLGSPIVKIVLFDQSNHFLCVDQDRDSVNEHVIQFLNKTSLQT